MAIMSVSLLYYISYFLAFLCLLLFCVCLLWRINVFMNMKCIKISPVWSLQSCVFLHFEPIYVNFLQYIDDVC